MPTSGPWPAARRSPAGCDRRGDDPRGPDRRRRARRSAPAASVTAARRSGRTRRPGHPSRNSTGTPSQRTDRPPQALSAGSRSNVPHGPTPADSPIRKSSARTAGQATIVGARIHAVASTPDPRRSIPIKASVRTHVRARGVARAVALLSARSRGCRGVTGSYADWSSAAAPTWGLVTAGVEVRLPSPEPPPTSTLTVERNGEVAVGPGRLVPGAAGEVRDPRALSGRTYRALIAPSLQRLREHCHSTAPIDQLQRTRKRQTHQLPGYRKRRPQPHRRTVRSWSASS